MNTATAFEMSIRKEAISICRPQFVHVKTTMLQSLSYSEQTAFSLQQEHIIIQLFQCNPNIHDHMDISKFLHI